LRVPTGSGSVVEAPADDTSSSDDSSSDASSSDTSSSAAAAAASPSASSTAGDDSDDAGASQDDDSNADATPTATKAAPSAGSKAQNTAAAHTKVHSSAAAAPTKAHTSSAAATSATTTTAAPATSSQAASNDGDSSDNGGLSVGVNLGLGVDLGGGGNSGSSSPPSSGSGSSSGGSGLGNKYTMYHGDGSPSAGWPSESQWVGDFETMWTANQANINCNGVPQNSAEETANMKSAIKSVASQSGLDARFIFAIILQESNGCVRVKPTQNGNFNPGLMQDANGKHMCNDGAGNIQNPCPMEEITGMIQEGVMGTGYDMTNGFKPLIDSHGGPSDAQNYYVAAKLYNSGQRSDILQLSLSLTATACYSSDIANRLTGWTTAASGCH
jgi:hypothetical protein